MSTKTHKKLRPKSSSTTIISELKKPRNTKKAEKTEKEKEKEKEKNKEKNVMRYARIKSAYSEAPVDKTYTIDNLVSDILNGKITNIVCVVGAGISTPSGIPDFRSPGTGLYDNLKQFKIPYPEAIFDIEYFNYNPKPFFTLAKEIMPSIKYKPNKIHYFLRLLQEKQLLHRLYTQNIDGLERLAGISSDKLVEAHGTFSSARCLGCKTLYSETYIRKAISLNQIPYCKKSDCSEIVKPNIVFFGESLPKRFDLHPKDFSRADLVIIMGTSLEVEPFAGVIKTSPVSVPRLLINREAVGPFKKCKRKTDLKILGDLLVCLDDLIVKLGWQKELEVLIASEIDRLDENLQRTLNAKKETNPEKGDNDTEDDKISVRQIPNSRTSSSSLSNITNSKKIKEPLRQKVNYNEVIPTSKRLTNEDLSRNEQLSGVYYLKDNFSFNTYEIISRRREQQIQLQKQENARFEITDEIRHKIIQQNNDILGLNKINNENMSNNNNNNNQTLLNKRKQIESHRFKNSFSDLSGTNDQFSVDKLVSNETFLPPNYKTFLARRNKFNQSPFSTKTFTQEVKISSKFYANSKPLLNASILQYNNKVQLNSNDDEQDDDSEDDDSGSSTESDD